MDGLFTESATRLNRSDISDLDRWTSGEKFLGELLDFLSLANRHFYADHFMGFLF
jgi:hypothetical protein